MVWLEYFACLVIIMFAGSKLSKYGDVIVKKTGLGGLWIGLVLIAVVTSAPEVTVGVSAATLVGLPDLALGALFGSCIFNLSILALLDILHGPVPILSRARLGHVTSAAMGILLLVIASGGILAGKRFPGLAFGWVGISSVLILILYLVGVRQIFCLWLNRSTQPPENDPPQYALITSKSVYLKFALTAIAVVGAGIWVSFVGDKIAETTGWGAGFVGNLFLAISTSMPELVVAIAALRLNAINIAISVILGANMLDILAITWIDLFYTKGPVLAAVSNDHIITAMVAVIMNCIVIAGLFFKQKHKFFIVSSWYSPALIGLYIFGAYASFTSGAGLLNP